MGGPKAIRQPAYFLPTTLQLLPFARQQGLGVDVFSRQQTPGSRETYRYQPHDGGDRPLVAAVWSLSHSIQSDESVVSWLILSVIGSVLATSRRMATPKRARGTIAMGSIS